MKADVAGIKNSEKTDGISFYKEMIGEDQKKHDFLYWEYPASGGLQAIRMGKWKGIKRNLFKGPSKLELYDLSVDEKELTNGMMAYASQYPGQEKQIIEYFKKNPSAIETVRGPILEEKVINAVISASNIVKKKITKSEYENLEKITFDVNKD